ncbi:MAG: lactate racemase domain-containing protein [Armatimonadota bacterium]
MVVGDGCENRVLTESEIESIAAKALSGTELDGKRVLLVVPDHTRTAPVPFMYRTIYRLLAERVKAVDVLIALGTHPPMPMEHIYQHMGLTAEEHAAEFPKTRFFNHLWKDPDSLAVVGTIPAEKIEEVSGGRFSMPVKLAVNKLVLEYDHLMILGPVFPHEVVGFSGGNKYIFPGIAGQEIIDFFHWLGALITNPMIIGNKYTPVRQVVDIAASYVPTPRSCFAMVIEHGDVAGLYYGTPEDAWSAASDLSDKLHICYKERPFHTVISCAPAMYDDLWTGGKCMYKLEPVVADGGKLIIYAPHITEISYTHGKVLDEIGYHTRDYFIAQWERFKDYPWGVVAHSTHVRGIGTCENGVEKPRVDVILATGIPEERCRQVNLGYMDPASIRVEDYMDKEDEGILYVQKAGEMLYRLRGGE